MKEILKQGKGDFYDNQPDNDPFQMAGVGMIELIAEHIEELMHEAKPCIKDFFNAFARVQNGVRS